MKDLMLSVPKWYDEKREEYNEILKNALRRDKVNIKIYSNAVKKVVVDAFDNGAENRFYGIYDFEKNVFYKIGDGMPIYRVSGDVDCWHKQCGGSFAWFELPNGRMNGEYIETYK